MNALSLLMVCTVPTEKSGIPIVIRNLLQAMDKNGMRIGYVSINEPSAAFREMMDRLGVKIYVIQREISHPLSYIRALSKVAKGYDVMHVHGNSATMVLEMIAARMAGCRLRIAHSHNTTCTRKTIDKYARPLFYRLCNGPMACGLEAGQWLFRSRHFSVINNGIDTSKFKFNQEKREEYRHRLGLDDNKWVIGNIGNFVELKNHRFLIEIFREFKTIRPESTLLLLGDGPLKQEIMDQVAQYRLQDSVIFAGSVENPADYMSAMDFIVMPSLHEGLPLTLIEEQANGLSALVADTITKDADLSGRISYRSLNLNAADWARAIAALIPQARHDSDSSSDAIANIRKAGYDIYEVAARLKEYYHRHTSSKK